MVRPTLVLRSGWLEGVENTEQAITRHPIQFLAASSCAAVTCLLPLGTILCTAIFSELFL
jgi:hypothetical protein